MPPRWQTEQSCFLSQNPHTTTSLAASEAHQKCYIYSSAILVPKIIRNLSASLERLTLILYEAEQLLLSVDSGQAEDSTSSPTNALAASGNTSQNWNIGKAFPNLRSLRTQRSLGPTHFRSDDFKCLPPGLTKLVTDSSYQILQPALPYLPKGLLELRLSVPDDALAFFKQLPPSLTSFTSSVACLDRSMYHLLPKNLVITHSQLDWDESTAKTLPRTLQLFNASSFSNGCAHLLPPGLATLNLSRIKRAVILDGPTLHNLPKTLRTLLLPSLDWPSVQTTHFPPQLTVLDCQLCKPAPDNFSALFPRSLRSFSSVYVGRSYPPIFFESLPPFLTALSIVSTDYDGAHPSFGSVLTSLQMGEFSSEWLRLLPPMLASLQVEPSKNWTDRSLMNIRSTSLTRLNTSSGKLPLGILCFIPKSVTDLMVRIADISDAKLEHKEKNDGSAFSRDLDAQKVELLAALPRQIRNLSLYVATFPPEALKGLPPALKALSLKLSRLDDEHLKDLPRNLRNFYVRMKSDQDTTTPQGSEFLPPYLRLPQPWLSGYIPNAMRDRQTKVPRI